MSLAFKSKKEISRSLPTLRHVLADRVYRGMQRKRTLPLGAVDYRYRQTATPGSKPLPQVLGSSKELLRYLDV
jgi:hypothetical protein